jgi:uncharacterized damage-inducible protein DinB
MSSYDVAPLSGYPIEYGLLLSTLQDGTREWRQEIGEPSEDAIVWQAVPGGHSIGGLLLHIADVEIFWFEEAALGRKMSDADLKLFMSEETKQYEGAWPVPPREPWAWYMQILDDVRARTLRTVQDFPESSDTFHRRTSTFTYRWALAHVVEHESYHAGQAVLLSALHGRSASVFNSAS